MLDLPIDEWRKAPSGDDVVAMDITEFVNSGNNFEALVLGNEVRREEPFYKIGTDLVMLGLFVDAEDIKRNVPRGRFGNLSAFADDEVPLPQGNEMKRPSHVADMRSRTDFSGSPVYGYYSLPVFGGTKFKFKLLGIHSGQFPERVEISTESRSFGCQSRPA